MLNVLRRFLVVLVAFAVLSATTSQFAHSAAYAVVTVGVPCDMTHAGMAPCKTMTVDCMKQLGCVADVMLPAHFVGEVSVIRLSSVDYWEARAKLAGLVRTPEPLPPRTI